MALAYLHRIDPKANMARFYCIDIAPNLFGEVCVLRTWGRIGTRGQTRIETCAALEDVEQHSMKMLKAKLRRGYRAV
jgi:predicted DNA-binding WGR domain protein